MKKYISMLIPAIVLLSKAALADTVVVDFKDNISESEWQSVSQDIGYTIRDNSPNITDDGKVGIVSVPSNKVKEVLDKLKESSYVEAAEPEFTLQASMVPNDPLYPRQWGLKRVGAESAWDKACGRGVVVAVVDTGVTSSDSTNHTPMTDLAKDTVLSGYSFVDDNEDPYDAQGHGSHVSGTIAQHTNNGLGASGLAHCAKILPVKVLSDSGSGSNEDVAEGIRWAADHGADVINLSLGGPGKSSVIELAVAHAISKNVLVVVAAGNDGTDQVGSPGNCKGVVVVSATDDKDKLAHFSTHGPLVSIGAPGVSILQETVDGRGTDFKEFNGTSMATPHVAAAAAILKSQGVYSQESLKKYLFAGADKKNDPEKFGAGILNIKKSASSFSTDQFLYLICSYLATFIVLKSWLKINVTKGFLVGSFWSGIGLLPFFGMLHLGDSWWSWLLSTPFGGWDRFFDVSWHEFGLTSLPIMTFVLLTCLYGFKACRKFVGGFALGQASYLLYTMLFSEEHFIVGTSVWSVLAVAGMMFCGFALHMTEQKD